MSKKAKDHSEEIKLLKKQLQEMELKYDKAKKEIENYQYLTTNISDIIWILDPVEQKLLYVSNSAEKVFGYSPKEFLEISLSDLFTNDSFNLLQEVISTRLNKFTDTSEIINYTDNFTQIHKDGSEVYTELKSYFNKNRLTGKIEVIGTTRDITERKKAGKALSESEDTAKVLLNAPTDIILMLDTRGKLLAVNETAVHFYGKTEDELIGQRIWDFLPKDAVEYRKPYVEKVIQSGESIRFEDKRDESWYDNVLYPIFDDHKKVIRIAVFARDITERKKAEESLLKFNEILEKIFDTTHFSVVYLDKDFNFIRVNKSYADACGYKADVFPGKNHFDLYPNEENESIFRSVVKTGKPFSIYAKPFEFPDHPEWGVTYWDWSLYPVKNVGRNVENLLFILLEVTEQTKAKEKIKKFNEELEQKVIQRTHDLGERVKELNCLYGISKLIENQDISLDEIFQGTVELILSSWKYPQITCTRLTYKNTEFKSKNFKETPWKQSSHIIVFNEQQGNLEVCYLEERPEMDEGPFLIEERKLINAVTEHLGQVIERTENKKELETYHLFVKNANSVILHWTQDGRITYINEYGEKLFGYSSKEIIGENVVGTIVPETESMGRDLSNIVDDICKNPQTYRYNVNENICKDGSRLWIAWANTIHKNEDTGEIEVWAIGTDISAQHVAEKKLKERVKELNCLYNISKLIENHEITLEKVFQGIVKLIPPSWQYPEITCVQLVYEDSEFQTENFRETQWKQTNKITVFNKEVGSLKVYYLEERSNEDEGVFLAEERKLINAITEQIVMIIERKQTKNDLLQAKEEAEAAKTQLQNILDASQIGIAISSQEIIRFANPQFKTMFGFGVGGTSPQTYVKDGEHDKILELLKKEGKLLNYEVQVYDIEHHVRDLLVSYIPINYYGEEGVLGWLLDITDRKEIEKELIEQKLELIGTLDQLKETQTHLVQSEKMASLGVLIAGVAHEINNPVNFISSSILGIQENFDHLKELIELYKKQSSENNETLAMFIREKEEEFPLEVMFELFDKAIKNMLTGVERTTKIVKGLRTFTHASSKNLSIYNIHENIDDTLVILYNQYKKHIQIIKNYGDIPKTEYFADQINQVWMNILSNAIQAIDKKGTITISTDRIKNDRILISIKDTGCGMTDDVASKIFDPFFTTKPVGKGIGLGLSIVYNHIKNNGGEIKLKSKPGEGTEFKILLPIHLK